MDTHEPSAQRTLEHEAGAAQSDWSSTQLPSGQRTDLLVGHVDLAEHRRGLRAHEPSGHVVSLRMHARVKEPHAERDAAQLPSWHSKYAGGHTVDEGQFSAESTHVPSWQRKVRVREPLHSLTSLQSALLVAHEPSGHTSCPLGHVGAVGQSLSVSAQLPSWHRYMLASGHALRLKSLHSPSERAHETPSGHISVPRAHVRGLGQSA